MTHLWENKHKGHEPEDSDDDNCPFDRVDITCTQRMHDSIVSENRPTYATFLQQILHAFTVLSDVLIFSLLGTKVNFALFIIATNEHPVHLVFS